MYNKNPYQHKDAKIIGCTGLQKICYPYTLTQYNSMINNKFTPSKISMFLTRDFYSKLPNRYSLAQNSQEEASLCNINNYLMHFGFTPVPTIIPFSCQMPLRF